MRPLAMYVPEPGRGSSVPIDLFTAFALTSQNESRTFSSCSLVSTNLNTFPSPSLAWLEHSFEEVFSFVLGEVLDGGVGSTNKEADKELQLGVAMVSSRYHREADMERLDLCLLSCSLILIVLDSEYCDVLEPPSNSYFNTLGGLRQTRAHFGLSELALFLSQSCSRHGGTVGPEPQTLPHGGVFSLESYCNVTGSH
ncbi:hypothetical protein Tco_1009182 [Tanacetum coccineum]